MFIYYLILCTVQIYQTCFHDSSESSEFLQFFGDDNGLGLPSFRDDNDGLGDNNNSVEDLVLICESLFFFFLFVFQYSDFVK